MADKIVGKDGTGEPIYLDEKTGQKYTLIPRSKPKKEENVENNVDEKVKTDNKEVGDLGNKNVGDLGNKNVGDIKTNKIIDNKIIDIKNIKEDRHKMADVDVDRLEEKLDRRLNEKMNSLSETIVNRLRGELVGNKKQEEYENNLKTAVKYSEENKNRLDKLETNLEKIEDLEPGELKKTCVGFQCYVEEQKKKEFDLREEQKRYLEDQKKKEEDQKRYWEEQRKISEGLNDRVSKLQESMLVPCPNPKCGRLIHPLTGKCPYCKEDIENWTADDGTVWVKER